MIKNTKLLPTIGLIMTLTLGFSQNVAPNASQKQLHEKKIEERKNEYINNFLLTLDADDFQKEIIRQKIDEFFDKKANLYKMPYKRSIEFEEALRKLEENHFNDIENMLTEENMTKIKEMVKGEFDEKEVVNEKKKKGKKNKKN